MATYTCIVSPQFFYKMCTIQWAYYMIISTCVQHEIYTQYIQGDSPSTRSSSNLFFHNNYFSNSDFCIFEKTPTMFSNSRDFVYCLVSVLWKYKLILFKWELPPFYTLNYPVINFFENKDSIKIRTSTFWVFWLCVY